MKAVTPDKRVDPAWLRSNFPCAQACPVGTEAGRYVHLIAQGRFREAYRVAREPNPFASICGRICAAPCEQACRRGATDAPISIRGLKRFVCERFGVESMIDLERLEDIIGPALPRREERVAIVGAGPAGLSAAHDLALMGYRVTVFEAQSVPGGMLRLGIPAYRLPRELIRLEILAILSLGVTLEVNQRLGRDFTLQGLRDDGYQAVFLAIGAHKSRALQMPGVELDGVLNAVDFLLNVNLGYKVELGERVVVVGGGNVAIDVARTAARRELEPENTARNMTEALDVARSAVRFGAREVHLICLESRQEMPADPEEVAQAGEEHIRLYPSRGPTRLLGEGGRVVGVETLDVASVFDANGRFNPQFRQGTERIVGADSVILAIGQASDLSFLSPTDGIEVTPRGTIRVERETLATTRGGVFAGGDLAFGPRLVIDAVADGRRAAQAIHEHLAGSPPLAKMLDLTIHDRQTYRQMPDFERLPRQAIPALPIARRVGIAQVELGYDEETACREASRCLRCWINTIFEGHDRRGDECLLCGGCMDVCPEDCIELVAGSRLVVDGEDLELLRQEYRLGAAQPCEVSVILKDETACSRCGLCARRCPVGCITMESFDQNQPGD